MNIEDMVQRFQCPGCVCGSDTRCGKYKPSDENLTCEGHVLGTSMLGLGSLALGLPKGFCRAGFEYSPPKEGRLEDNHRNTMLIRMFPKGVSSSR